MPRKYYKRRIYGKKDKYSIENRIVQTDATEDWDLRDGGSSGLQQTHQRSFVVVSPTDVQGIRKVKHFTMTFTSNSVGELKPLAYALVYVPEGYFENDIKIPIEGNLASVNMYEPSQFIISQGILDFSGGPLRVRSPLSRNLNSGDRIMLVFSAAGSWNWDESKYTASVSYAISYQ